MNLTGWVVSMRRVLLAVVFSVGLANGLWGQDRPGPTTGGLANDGRTDDSQTMAGACVAGREVWLAAGPGYLMGQSATLACDLHIAAGARLVVPAGVRVTLTGAVHAPAVPVFATSGTGSVVFGAATGSVPVEWFGAVPDGSQKTGAGTDNTAAIQRALDAIQVSGTVQLQCRTYAVGSTLRITRSSVNLYGGECEGLDGAQSILLMTSAAADILQLHSPAGVMQWNRLRNLSLIRAVVPQGRARGLSLDNVGGYDLDHVSSEDNGVGFYFHAAPSYAVGSSRYLHVGWGFGFVKAYQPGSQLVGYELDSEDGQAENSIILRISTASASLPAGVISTGYLVHGAAINDVNVESAQTAATTYGVVIRYTGKGGGFGAGDLWFTNGTFDAYTRAGILVENVPASALGAVNFNGGYVLQIGANAAGPCGVEIRNSVGVTVTGMQIGNASGSGVCLENDRFAKVVANTFHVTADAGVRAVSTTLSVIGENTFEGPGKVGLSFDAASGRNAVVGNAIDPAKTLGVQDLSNSGYEGAAKVR